MLEFKDQRNVYLFTPPITGRYRFEISNLTKGSDHEVNLLVYNSGGGEEASTSYGIMNGDGLTIASMQAGQTYEIQIRQYSGIDSYNLNIGYQKDSLDITGFNIIADSIQYRDQKNIYFFTPTVTGRYRFEISNLAKGSSNEVNLYVWNSRGGEEGSTSYGIMNGEGLTIKDMQAGETYQIQVRQYSGYDMYNLNLGLQKETVDISEYSSVSDSGYEETFIKFFASSSLGISFKYSNDDIQEILSRIGHYNGVTTDIAERILARELVNSRYLTASTDEEKEEIIYNSVSDELLIELDLTREQVAFLESKKNQLDEDCKVALDLLDENDAQFKSEKLRLQAEADEARQQRDAEATARQQAETESHNTKKYSDAQEELYVNEKMKAWKRKHYFLFAIGVLLSGAVVILSLFLWQHLKDSGCLSLLGALAITVPLAATGGKVFSIKATSEARQDILNIYHTKLKR